MRRLHRFMSAHSLHLTPQARSREELGVIADRLTTGPAAAVTLPAPPPDHSDLPVDRTLVSR
jgi:hypothetical protein